jgi:rRNA maturation RNase YbeY
MNETKVVDSGYKALKYFGFPRGVELSLIFVGRKKARDLNKQYRGKDYIPQVLAFPMSKDVEEDGYIRLGDVVICTAKLRAEVKYLKKGINEIMDEWMKHGVENLLKS